MKLFLYLAQGTNPYRNLAVEQYLLEHVPRDACILYLWQNRHTVVIGRNQNAWQECRTARLEADGGFLARRLSGGGAVFHDLGNLNFTFLVNKADYSVEKQLSVIVEACRSLGIPAERSGRNDVLTGGRKFSGNAFYEHQGRCYHHGTLLVDVDMEAMGRYLSPSTAKLQAKGVSSVRSRVVNLRELRRDLTIPMLREALTGAFSQVYGLPCVVALNSFPSDTEAERQAVYAYCKQQGVECALSEVFAKGGEGGLELAQKVLDIMDDDAKINYAYDEDLTVDEKIKVLCSKIYGAKEVIFNKPALTMLKTLKANGYDKLPVCVAKTQYSFSDNASLLAAPTDFTMTVRELRLSAGAGFVVAVMGEIMTMPGLPKVPAALSIDVDENGVIKGLF